jgi:hypothetical protein
MKIVQLLSGIEIPLTNEEKQFVLQHKNHIFLKNLDEHNRWIAQNLVRKGVYSISNDNQTLIKNLNETST